MARIRRHFRSTDKVAILNRRLPEKVAGVTGKLAAENLRQRLSLHHSPSSLHISDGHEDA